MTHRFDNAAVEGVLGHMNNDHPADNMLIAQAFSGTGTVSSATMIGFDGDGGTWSANSPDGAVRDIRVPWPNGAITERHEVRREIVALYDAACARLGVDARPHS